MSDATTFSLTLEKQFTLVPVRWDTTDPRQLDVASCNQPAGFVRFVPTLSETLLTVNPMQTPNELLTVSQ